MEYLVRLFDKAGLEETLDLIEAPNKRTAIRVFWTEFKTNSWRNAPKYLKQFGSATAEKAVITENMISMCLEELADRLFLVTRDQVKEMIAHSERLRRALVGWYGECGGSAGLDTADRGDLFDAFSHVVLHVGYWPFNGDDEDVHKAFLAAVDVAIAAGRLHLISDE